jgi:hypothetical protein
MKRWKVLVTSALAVGFAFFLYSVDGRRGTEYRIFRSPDGRFSVVIYSSNRLLPIMPGQSGDPPGVVCLRDATGETLASEKVEMVQNVDQVNWSKTNVHIKFVADWKLPP